MESDPGFGAGTAPESDAEFLEQFEKGLRSTMSTVFRDDITRLFSLARRGAAVRGKIVMPAEDYRRLIEAAECDDRLEWCETCGAWMDHDDPARASTDDYHGCWKVAAGEDATPDNCRSYRAPSAIGEPK